MKIHLILLSFLLSTQAVLGFVVQHNDFIMYHPFHAFQSQHERRSTMTGGVIRMFITPVFRLQMIQDDDTSTSDSTISNNIENDTLESAPTLLTTKPVKCPNCDLCDGSGR